MQCPFYVIPLVLEHVTFPMGPSDWIFTPWWIYSTTSMDWLMLAQLELLARMKELGLRLNAKKGVLLHYRGPLISRVVWDSTMMA